jgi:DNA modification methylase
MAAMPEGSIDAIVCDPPYGLEFMGKEWDKLWATDATRERITGRQSTSPLAGKPRYGDDAQSMQQWHQQWATAALRVAKPGAYLLAFGGTRTVHRMTVALEDAGWIIRDMLVWAYACLSDDTEILTDEGWVRYNSASEGQHAAAFDPGTGRIQWERIEAVHRYDHEGPMALVGPQLVTLNHRVIIDEDAAAVPRLPSLRGDVHEAGSVAPQGTSAGVLAGVQREAASAGPEVPYRDSRGLDTGVVGVLSAGDVWPEQSRLEGRRYRVQEAWELLGGSLRARLVLGIADGAVGRIRHGAPAGDGPDVRVPADQDGMREPREPRPDRQSTREPDTLAGQPDAQAVRAWEVPDRDGEPDAVRVIEGYSGVVWCITVPSGAFVARRNGVVFVTGNSGFPKSKALLKPAWEPIVMARKPGPLRDLDIDGCRIGYASDDDRQAADDFRELRTKHPGGSPIYAGGKGLTAPTTESVNPSGRWPANVVLTDPVFDGGWEGVVGGGEAAGSKPSDWSKHAGDAAFSVGRESSVFYDDTGTYSRFFLVPKASRSDREPVMPGMLEEQEHGAYNGGAGLPGRTLIDGKWTMTGTYAEPNRKKRSNVHPTVKPIDLMRHLVRLVTPIGGTVLDPFLGSGTTALAAEQEGRDWVGIEREAEYVRIAEARLSGWQRGLGLDVA